MPPVPLGELTEGELRFCEEYAAAPSATQAYRRAFPGTSAKVASVGAVRLLAKVRVRGHVLKLRKAYLRQVDVDALKTLNELAGVAFADIGDLFEPDPDNGGLPKPRKWADVPPAARRAIQTVRVTRRRLREKGAATEWEIESLEFKAHPKLDALKTLCQYLGLTGENNAIREAIRAKDDADARRAAPPAGAGGGEGPNGDDDAREGG